jgi:tRNA U34 5-carboxymethylaminomethyl modifying GTPase MnmE/TrmE
MHDKTLFLDNVSKMYKNILTEKEQKSSDKKQRDKNKLSPTLTNENAKKISRSLTFDSLNSFNIDFNSYKNIDDISVSSDSTSINSFSSILLNPVLSKNIDIVDDVLKLVLIGDHKVGKSLFINKLLYEEGKIDIGNYNKTKSFEIKKKIIKLLGKHIRLELFDTNCEIVDSEMFKGKITF